MISEEYNLWLMKWPIWAHSWFATVVDGNELGSVYPFQRKKLKYEDP